MTRDEGRTAFASADLTYDVLTPENVRKLRASLNREMRASGLISGTYHMRQRARFYKPPFFAVELTCRSYYFDRREAITFNANGFIGFAGWSDEHNVQPILSGFAKWIDEVRP